MQQQAGRRSKGRPIALVASNVRQGKRSKKWFTSQKKLIQKSRVLQMKEQRKIINKPLVVANTRGRIRRMMA